MKIRKQLDVKQIKVAYFVLILKWTLCSEVVSNSFKALKLGLKERTHICLFKVYSPSNLMNNHCHQLITVRLGA